MSMYRVWPDGTVQDSEEPAHSYMSDDYQTVAATSESAAYYQVFPRDPKEVQISRLKRKLEKKDKQIEVLKKRVAALGRQLMLRENLPMELTSAVQQALTNVRLISVTQTHKAARITMTETFPKPESK